MYIHGGLSRSGLRGDILKADLTKPQLEWILLQGQISSPEPRAYHSLDRIADKAYLFGGSDGKRIFGDFWIFNIVQETWKSEFGYGVAPLARN